MTISFIRIMSLAYCRLDYNFLYIIRGPLRWRNDGSLQAITAECVLCTHRIVNNTTWLAESRSPLDYCPACLTHRSPPRGRRQNEGVEAGATFAARHQPLYGRMEGKLLALSLNACRLMRDAVAVLSETE